jgi:hypothetical protein
LTLLGDELRIHERHGLPVGERQHKETDLKRRNPIVLHKILDTWGHLVPCVFQYGGKLPLEMGGACSNGNTVLQ